MNKPHHLFVDQATVDQSALHDFYEAMEQPFVLAGAVMPDLHKGYTLPIGSVIATEGVVVPAYVSFDIGCGVCAIQTTAARHEVEEVRDELFSRIYEAVPTGNGKGHAESIAWNNANFFRKTALAESVYKKRNGASQFGSLGSGNHFIEIGYDEHFQVWVIIHSGSRGFGHGIATEYMKIASGSDKAKEGHYPLSLDSAVGKDYMVDLHYTLEYALANRIAMLDIISKVLNTVIGRSVRWPTTINRNHNHAVVRGDSVAKSQLGSAIIHRKGATHAEEGMLGVIPGNMRDGSFIVRGKGNPKSLWSSSHGAGRVMGRNEAKRRVTMEEFEGSMVGVTAKVDLSTLDESPMAYKSIFDVMEQQSELVDVVHHIKPIINIKA
jgi:tRNA-splicing ligase RtcB